MVEDRPPNLAANLKEEPKNAAVAQGGVLRPLCRSKSQSMNEKFGLGRIAQLIGLIDELG